MLAAHGFTHWSQLPLGAIVGRACIGQTYQTENIHSRLRLKELAFGDYSNGRIAIELLDPVRLAEPIPAKGALGLWDVPEEVRRQVGEILQREVKPDDQRNC